MQTRYLTSIVDASKLSPFDGPEIALVGRSNSGKSSFLNALTNVKGAARTSQTPGRTQMINVFEWEINKDHKIYLSDFPGYGFSLTDRKKKKMWGDTLHTYLQEKPLEFVVFLMDVRRDLTDEELEFLHGLPHNKILIATKADKLSKSAAQTRLQKLVATLTQARVEVTQSFLISNQSKEGLDRVLNYLTTGT